MAYDKHFSVNQMIISMPGAGTCQVGHFDRVSNAIDVRIYLFPFLKRGGWVLHYGGIPFHNYGKPSPKKPQDFIVHLCYISMKNTITVRELEKTCSI